MSTFQEDYKLLPSDKNTGGKRRGLFGLKLGENIFLWTHLLIGCMVEDSFSSCENHYSE